MQTLNLTNSAANNLPLGSGDCRDSQVVGLVFRVGKKKKTWYFVKRNGSRVVWTKLGDYPDITVKRAREIALVESSKTLLETQRPNHEYTLAEVFLNWQAKKGHLKKSARLDARMLKCELSPFSETKITKISADDIEQLKKIMSNTPILFNRVRALLSTLFNHARKKMRINIENITESVEKNPETAKKTKIPIEKSDLLFDALDSGRYPQLFSDIIKVFLYTGQRKSNVCQMEWNEVDFASSTWTIPAHKAKSGQDMPVTLSPEVMEILIRRHNLKKKSRFVFTSSRTGKAVNDLRKTFDILKAEISEPELTLHDLRRTFGTWMLNAGASIEQVSAALHHSSIAITQKVYAEMLTDHVRAGVDLMRGAIEKARKAQSGGSM